MEKYKDFVCGMEADRDKWSWSYDYQGTTYHFCSAKCKDDFSSNPGSFIK